MPGPWQAGYCKCGDQFHGPARKVRIAMPVFVFGRHRFLRLLRHRRKQRPVAHDVGDLVRDNQVVCCIHCRLNVISHNTRAAQVCRHGAGVRIGERDVLVRRLQDFLPDIPKLSELRLHCGDLVIQPRDFRFGDVALMKIGGVQRLQIPPNARFDLSVPVFELALGEVPVAGVDALELGAVDRGDDAREQAKFAADDDELRANRPDRGAVFLSEVDRTANDILRAQPRLKPRRQPLLSTSSGGHLSGHRDRPHRKLHREFIANWSRDP